MPKPIYAQQFMHPSLPRFSQKCPRSMSLYFVQQWLFSFFQETVLWNQQSAFTQESKTPWNKDKIIGQKRLLKLQEVWSIRIRLQLAENLRELALFDLAIDSKLRGCDLVGLRVSDIAHGPTIMHRAIVLSYSSRKPKGPSNLKSPSKPGRPWLHGLSMPISRMASLSSPAGNTPRRIFPRGSMCGLWSVGSFLSGWILRPMVPIPCAEPTCIQDDQKQVGYCLNHEHPEGRHKARVLFDATIGSR